jgi:hypothetical protein
MTISQIRYGGRLGRRDIDEKAERIDANQLTLWKPSGEFQAANESSGIPQVEPQRTRTGPGDGHGEVQYGGLIRSLFDRRGRVQRASAVCVVHVLARLCKRTESRSIVEPIGD